MKLFATTACATVLLASQAFAADTFRIDPTHTNVLVKANHIGFSNVYLKVRNVDGEFTFDQENPEDSEVTVTMQANSIDGFDEKFNEHLHGTDFFAVETYPLITFASTDIEVTGKDTAIITGDLTIKGMAQPATLNVTFNKAGKNPFASDYRAGFSATGTIKRSDYGITYAAPAVADEVGIVLEVEGIRVEERD